MRLSIDRAAWFWWIRVPLTLRRLSTELATVLVDGMYVVAWPVAAAIAPPAAMLVGLCFGAVHPGHENAFSESLLLVVVVITLGTMSGHLGAMFLVGYAFGDFFIAHPYWSSSGARFDPAPQLTLGGFVQNLIRVRIPLLIQYSLMSIVLVAQPVLTKTLLRQFSLLARLGRQIGLLSSISIHAAITFVQVYLWTQSVPVLIRPLFTWRGVEITAAAVENLQENSFFLAGLAVFASFIRMVLQALTAFMDRYRKPVDAMQEALMANQPETPLADRLPTTLVALLRAFATIFLLAGIYESWLDGMVLAALVLLITAARHRIITIPLGRWPSLIERVPLLARLIGGMLFMLGLTLAFEEAIGYSETFRSLVILVGISFVVFYLLVPASSATENRPRHEEQPA